jgi:integrase
MPRQPKPYFRKQTQTWYFSSGGRQINLGKDRKAAFDRFHELMADKETLRSGVTSVYEMSQVYLDWCQANRKPPTYARHRFYLKSFIDFVGKKINVSMLRPHHLSQWASKDSWSSTSRNDAMGAVQRMLNWAAAEGYISRSPLPAMKKPRRRRRDIVYTPEQWQQIQSFALGPLVDLLDFLWLTGCRPREARILTANHVHDDLVIFRPEESKGETDARVIFLVPEARAILDRLAKVHPDGPLFRNSKGAPWTKDAIKCRLTRISQKVGFRVIAYGARHSYATNALIRAVDAVSLSHLMGHKSTRMINNYAHLSNNIEFLKQQARNAAGLREDVSQSPGDDAAETE